MNFTYSDIANKLNLKFYMGDNNFLVSLMLNKDGSFMNFAGRKKGEKQFYLLVKDIYPSVDFDKLKEDFFINIKLITANYNIVRDYNQKSSLYPNFEFRYEKSDEPEYKKYSETFNKLDNLVLPINDSFWNTYLPPNHFGDNCTVRVTDKDITSIPDNLPRIDNRFIVNRHELFFDIAPFINTKESNEGKITPNNKLYLESLGINIEELINESLKDIKEEN